MISFTSKLMAYLEELLPGLTPEVFRTHNASLVLETMLSEEMGDADVNHKEVLKELETGSGGEKARNLNPKAWRKKIQQTKLKINQMERQMRFEFHTKVHDSSNFMDPKITIAWCKRNQVPTEKVLNEFLMEKFPWVMKGESDFKHNASQPRSVGHETAMNTGFEFDSDLELAGNGAVEPI
ncbi:unnamed protein product [Thlaspi arvense]|uniref:Topoisomerase I C-terminal domain-containing protein n=1 Tax=Thlaspi arvense TaxID=13288 RepID=A0AAU9SPV4_THLAR|nr:unnamed protein product [Thlaspi arvense]